MSPVSRCSAGELGEDRRRLLGADDAHRHELRLGPHRRLDEAAAPEAPQAVAVLEELLGALAPLGEDEHELALVVEQPVHVRRVRGDAADLRDQHREARIALEEVLDGDVQRPRVRVLLADRLADHRGVGRQRARVVGDEQRAARRPGRSRSPRPRRGTSSGRRTRPASASKKPSTRSERPQSSSWRSGSIAGSSSRIALALGALGQRARRRVASAGRGRAPASRVGE